MLINISRKGIANLVSSTNPESANPLPGNLCFSQAIAAPVYTAESLVEFCFIDLSVRRNACLAVYTNACLE